MQKHMQSRYIDTAMKLQVTARYIDIAIDFQIINRSHKEFGDYVSSHPLLNIDNLNRELERVTKSWQRGGTIAGRSMDGDLSNLRSSVHDIKITEAIAISSIDFLIDNSLNYFNELSSDHSKGYVSDAKMKEYMQMYKEAIDKNKGLGLESFNKPITEKILQKIDEILN